MAATQLRATVPSPIQDDPAPTANKHIIIFKHPGYPDEYDQNVLLQLYAWDSPNGGLHAGTALLACTLIACNAWNGYLTRERDGPRLELHHDDVLSAQEYYFHVPNFSVGPIASVKNDSPFRYPIYPSFRHWTFPHRHIPTQWREQNETDIFGSVTTIPPSVSAVTAAVLHRDKYCIVSKCRDYIERAHLCPRNELDWFRENGLRRYNAQIHMSGDAIVDDMANALAMRADIHRAFDDCNFVLVPKCGHWTVHFLEKTYDLGPMYHNRPIEVASVPTEFILTRFAWAIFPLVKPFMEQGLGRIVKIREQRGQEFYEVVKELDTASFAQMTATNRGRSNSPKKRKATDPLPPIAEAKHLCTSLYHETDEMQAPTSGPNQRSEDGHAPDLSFSPGTPVKFHHTLNPSLGHAVGILPQGPRTEDDDEIDRLSALRMNELRKRRPRDSTLLCCDYSLAEKANALGIPGRPEYGGGHLCPKCLGFEDAYECDE
ncbi:MAG: hypothetical protein Q9160_008780 [Pyrenula sp. 1 TL-2023]